MCEICTRTKPDAGRLHELVRAMLARVTPEIIVFSMVSNQVSANGGSNGTNYVRAAALHRICIFFTKSPLFYGTCICRRFVI